MKYLYLMVKKLFTKLKVENRHQGRQTEQNYIL